MTGAKVPTGVIAIVRLRHQQAVDEIHDALVQGGIGAVEITVPTPGSLDAISRWRRTGQAVVGAGTIRTAHDAQRAIDAGAQFLVTPTTMRSVLELATAAGVPVVSGALTPTEIDTAWQNGASAVKVFPIEAVGGVRYLQAVLGPIDDVPFIPTGGVGLDTTADYARVGCVGVGISSNLVDEAIVAAGEWAVLTERAEAFVRAWRSGLRDDL